MVQTVVYVLSCIGVGRLDDFTAGKAGFLFPGLGASIACIGHGMLAPIPLNFDGHVLRLSLLNVMISVAVIGLGEGLMIAPMVRMMADASGHEKQEDRVMCAGIVFS